MVAVMAFSLGVIRPRYGWVGCRHAHEEVHIADTRSARLVGGQGGRPLRRCRGDDGAAAAQWVPRNPTVDGMAAFEVPPPLLRGKITTSLPSNAYMRAATPAARSAGPVGDDHQRAVGGSGALATAGSTTQRGSPPPA